MLICREESSAEYQSECEAIFIPVNALPAPNIGLLNSATYRYFPEVVCKLLRMVCPNIFPFWGIPDPTKVGQRRLNPARRGKTGGRLQRRSGRAETGTINHFH
jgi:hypothetical protein